MAKEVKMKEVLFRVKLNFGLGFEPIFRATLVLASSKVGNLYL